MGKIKRFIVFCESLSLMSVLFIVFLLILGSYLLQDFQYKSYISSADKEVFSLFKERKRQILKFISKNEKFLDIVAKLELSKEVIKSILSSEKNAKILKDFSLQIYDISHGHNIKNIFIFSKSGKLIFLNKKDGKINLMEEASNYKIPLNLLESFKRSQATLSSDISEFSYNFDSHEPNFFMTSPVYQNNHVIGFIAIQIDHTELYNISSDFRGLGKDGELILGKEVKNHVLFVAPTRKNKHGGFKKIVSFQDYFSSHIIEGTKGHYGKSFLHDKNKEEIYAVWGYIPKINLGIVIKKNVSDLLTTYKNFYIFSIILYILICSIVLIFLFRFFLLYTRKSLISTSSLRRIVLLFFIILNFISICGTYVYQVYKEVGAVQDGVDYESGRLRASKVQLIETIKMVENVVFSLVKDIEQGRVNLDNVSKRIRKDIKENSYITGISVTSSNFIFKSKTSEEIDYYFRNGLKISKLGIPINHQMGKMMRKNKDNIQKTEGFWMNVFKDSFTQKLETSFSVPVFVGNDIKRENLLIITVYYPVSSLKESIEQYDKGHSGHFFLVQQDGRFLYHPIDEYVLNGKVFFDIAYEKENDALFKINKSINKRQHKIVFYQEKKEHLYNSSIEILPLNITDWVLGKESFESDIVSESIHSEFNVIIIFIEVMIFFILLSCYFGKLYNINFKSIRVSCLLISIVLLVSNCFLWFIISKKSFHIDPSEKIITSMVDLKSFINGHHLESKILENKKFIYVPTGLFISTLRLNNTDKSLSMKSKVWQQNKFNVKENIGYSFTNALYSAKKEVMRERNNLYEKILWEDSSEVQQNLSFKNYPFDTVKLKIDINYDNLSAPYILIPDLNSYRYNDPYSKPGLSSNIDLGGFNIEESFFIYNANMYNTNFGLDEFSKSQAKPELSFVILLTRKLIDSIIVDILPLFVILILLYTVVLVGKQKEEIGNLLAVVVGLIFALIILHSNLRKSLGTNEFFYIEYMFFSGYFMIFITLLYIFYIFYLNKKYRENSIIVFMESLYWPVVLGSWIRASISTFY